MFPFAGGTAILCGRDIELSPKQHYVARMGLNQQKPEMTPKPATTSGRLQETSFHFEPGVHLFVPKAESFAIPLKYIDVTGIPTRIWMPQQRTNHSENHRSLSEQESVSTANVARWEDRQLEVARQAQASTIRVSRSSPRANAQRYAHGDGARNRRCKDFGSRCTGCGAAATGLRCHRHCWCDRLTREKSKVSAGQPQVLKMGVLGAALIRDWRCQTLHLLVETHGTEHGSLTADDTTIVLKIKFDFRHRAIVVSLALQETKHQETVA